MSSLLDAIAVDFQTDFAILWAFDSEPPPVDLITFATAGTDWVRALTGAKYSPVHAVAERWSAAPPEVDGWEDRDELPFRSTTGRIRVQGFDPIETALDLTGFDWGRVQILARGRHRYGYDSRGDEFSLPPEEWLLRFYPVDGPPDPLAAPPRTLAGPPTVGNAADLLANDLQAAVHVVGEVGLVCSMQRLADRFSASLDTVGEAMTALVTSGRAHVAITSGRDTLAPDDTFVMRASPPRGLTRLELP